MKIVKRIKKYTRYALMASILAVCGCGLFGAKAPTTKDIAMMTFNGVQAAVNLVDDKLEGYIADNELDQTELEKVQRCVDRLEATQLALDGAKFYLENDQEGQPGFKEQLGRAAKVLKLLLPDFKDLGLRVPPDVENAIDLAIAYSNVH